MVKSATTTVGTCCYIGCTKSFLTDKETVFLKFPDDLERRKKWIANCGNPELGTLAERQLRGKKICVNHFQSSAFSSGSTLKDTAVPIPYKKESTPSPATPTTSTKDNTSTSTPVAAGPTKVPSTPVSKPDDPGNGTPPPTVKRGRGRPPKIKQEVIIKCEPDEDEAEESTATTTDSTKEKKAERATVKAKPVLQSVAGKEKPPVSDNPAPALRVVKEKSAGPPTPTKRKAVVASGVNKEKTASAAVVKAKTVVTPGTTKEKINTASILVKEKTVVTAASPKDKTITSPGLVKEKSSGTATGGTAKDKQVVLSNIAKDKPTGTPNAAKDKIVSVLGLVKAKPVASGPSKASSTNKDKPSTPGTPSDKPTGTIKDKAAVTPNSAKGKAVVTPGTPKGKSASTASKEKSVGSSATVKEKVSFAGVAKEFLGTPGAVKEKPSAVGGVANTVPVAVKEKIPVTSTTAKEKSVVASVTSKDKSVAVSATPKEKLSVAIKRKSVASVASKEKSSAPGDLKKKPNLSESESVKNTLEIEPVKEKPAALESEILSGTPITTENETENSQDGHYAIVKEENGAEENANSRKRKRKKMTRVEKDLKSKLRRIAVDIIQPNAEVMDVDSSSGSSCDDQNDVASNSGCSSDEEDAKPNTNDNREFERFHRNLKANCVLPESWNLGAVLWDPTTKMKVIPASEVDISSNGTVRLKRSVQIYETMQTKVTVDGFDLTNRYDVKTVGGHQDVTRLVLRVARSKICCGIKGINAEDAMYFPDAVPRGPLFYSEACPVIISKQSMGPMCNNCHKLRNAIRRRKSEQKRAVEMRKAKRSSLHTVNSPFGKALYTLLSDLMADENDPKRKKRRSTLYSRGHNVCLKDKDGEGEKNAPERATNSASISYIMQDIVSKMSLGKIPQEQQTQYFKSENVMQEEQMEMQILNGSLDSNAGNLVVQNTADFTLAEGQEYELIGEVDTNVVQVVEMIKDRPNSPRIEIIEVDDHTLAQLTAQNMAGMFLQDTGQIHVNMSEVDVNSPGMGQLMKVIGPSHGF